MGDILLTVDFEGTDRGLPLVGAGARLPTLCDRLLTLLRDARAQTTFFVVGAVARQFPDLIRAIAGEGHELGLHTDTHRPLTKMTPAEFRADLERNRDALIDAGAGRVIGFRAPFFSFTTETRWAEEVMCAVGLRYDSSIVPGTNVLFGFPDAPEEPYRMATGLWEVPLPVFRGPFGRSLVVGGGTYLRLLPLALTQRALARYFRRGAPVCVYFHPYDIDPDGPFVRVFDNPLYDRLLRVGRDQTAAKVRQLIRPHRTSGIAAYLDRVEQEAKTVVAR